MTDTTAPVLGEATIQELREGVRGEVLDRQDPGYARGVPRLERRARRTASGARRPVRRRRGRRRRDRLRARQRPARRRARRRPQRRRLLDVRRRRRDRPRADARRTRRPGRADRVRRPRRRVGRRRPRDAGARPRDHGRPHLDDRRRGLHARRRDRVAHAPLRPRVRQPARGRRRDRRRDARPRRRDAEHRPALGSPRRRRQLRRRDPVRVRRSTRSDRSSTPARSSTRPTSPATSSACSANGRRARRTTSPALVNLTTAPPLPVIPEAWHGKKVAALIAASAGSPDAGAAQFAAFRDLAEPIADLLGPMPYTMIQSLIDPLWPKGIQAYFKATNLSRLDDALIDTLTDRHQDAPGPQCEIHVHQMGGAVGRVGPGRDGVRRALDAVRAERGDGLARRRRRAVAHATGRERRRGRVRPVDGTRLLELPGRPRRRPCRVRRRDVRPPRRRSRTATTRRTCSG